MSKQPIILFRLYETLTRSYDEIKTDLVAAKKKKIVHTKPTGQHLFYGGLYGEQAKQRDIDDLESELILAMVRDAKIKEAEASVFGRCSFTYQVYDGRVFACTAPATFIGEDKRGFCEVDMPKEEKK